MRWICLLLIAVGCTKCPKKVPPFTWESIPGREEVVGIVHPVYHVKVPHHWVRMQEPGSERDTMVANVTFLIDDELRVALHTFPAMEISPRAQVDRWESKLATAAISSFHHDGFSGLFLKGETAESTTLAWAYQLDPALAQRLMLQATTASEKFYYEQMAANFTIKVSGPTKLINKHEEEISQFAQSIQLIEEIP